jgi:hypothetical protein
MIKRGGKFHRCIYGGDRAGDFDTCARCVAAGPSARPWYREGEEWRCIPEFPDYLASSHGRVKHRSPARNPPVLYARRGYPRITILSADARKLSRCVHVLVTQAFLGVRPDGMVTNHIDGDKANNRPDNLEYVTQKENIRHAAAMGRHNNGPRKKVRPVMVIEREPK